MPFIGPDGLPRWRVNVILAKDLRPIANPLWERNVNGVDIDLSSTGTLSGAWVVSGTDVNLANPPGTDRVWVTIVTDVNLVAS